MFWLVDLFESKNIVGQLHGESRQNVSVTLSTPLNFITFFKMFICYLLSVGCIRNITVQVHRQQILSYLGFSLWASLQDFKMRLLVIAFHTIFIRNVSFFLSN